MALTDTYKHFIPFFSQFLYTAGDADSVGTAMQKFFYNYKLTISLKQQSRLTPGLL